LLVSVALFGLANHLDYLNVLSYLPRHGEAYYSNQSVNGLLNRLFNNAPSLEFQMDAYPPFHPVVYAGTAASSAALLALALFWPARLGQAGNDLDLSIVMLASIMASPLAWRHHYGAALPIFAVLFARLENRPRTSLAAWGLLAISYFLVGTHVAFVQQVARAAAPAPLQLASLPLSYLFAGALMLLGLLFAVRNARMEQAAP
jgi:hypothetical protein